MAHAPEKSLPAQASQSPASRGPERSATEARAGARKGLYRVLVTSTVLTLIALFLAWVALGSRAHSVSPHTDPNGQPVSSAH